MLMYEMTMFCNSSRLACRCVRQPAGAIGLSLTYCMTCVSIIERRVIALLYRYELAIVIKAIVDGDNHMTA
jgi:hypothetical protein